MPSDKIVDLSKAKDGFYSLPKKKLKKPNQKKRVKGYKADDLPGPKDAYNHSDEDNSQNSDNSPNEEGPRLGNLKRTLYSDEEEEDTNDRMDVDGEEQEEQEEEPRDIPQQPPAKKKKEMSLEERIMDQITSLNKQITDGGTNYDPKKPALKDTLIKQLGWMLEIWTAFDPTDKDELFYRVQAIIGKEVDDKIEPNQLHMLLDKYVICPIFMLKLRFHQANMLENDKYRDSDKHLKDFQRLFSIAYYATGCFNNYIMYAHRLRNELLDIHTNEIGTFRYITNLDLEEMDTFPQMLIHCLKKLQDGGYRKKDGFLYKPFYINGHFTNYWEACPTYPTIEKFVWGCINLDFEMEKFLKMYSQKASIPKNLIEVLKHIETSYLPELITSQFFQLYNNGIYVVPEDMFYGFDEFNPYVNGMGHCKTKDGKIDKIKEDSIRTKVINDLENLAKVHTDFESDFKGLINIIRNQQYENASDKSNGSLFKKRGVACSVYIDATFTYIPPSDDPDHPNHYSKIKVPAVEKMTTHQEWNDDTKLWFDVLFGRGLYPTGYVNNEAWHKAVMLLGTPGTGKSLILKLLQKLFPLGRTGLLSSNIEQQWGAKYLVEDKDIIIGSEVGPYCKLTEEELKQIITDDYMLLMQKYKDAKAFKPSIQVFIAANEMLKHRSAGGSHERRWVIFPYREHVDKKLSDPHLFLDALKDISLWVQKINRSYRDKAMKHAKENLDKLLPDFLKESTEKATKNLSSLQLFLKSMSNVTVKTNESSMREDEFVNRYNEFRKNVLKKRFEVWSEDIYCPVFGPEGIKVKTMKEPQSLMGGPEVYAKYIVGMKFIDGPSNNTIDNNANTNATNQQGGNIPNSQRGQPGQLQVNDEEDNQGRRIL